MRYFTETATCHSRLRCQICRARTPAGEAWRASIAEIFEFDGECTHGVPWDVAGDQVPAATVQVTVSGRAPPTPRAAIEEVGPKVWAKWHSHPSGSPALLTEGLAELPLGCACRDRFKLVLDRLPPVYGPGWFRRTWEWHEAVNAERNVAGMSFKDAAERWGRRDLIEQPTTAV